MNKKLAFAVAASLGAIALSSLGARDTRFDIPTGGTPSPLFGATEFSSAMLLFEEFGTQPMSRYVAPRTAVLPPTYGCNSFPDGAALDGLLSRSTLYPYPTRQAKVSLTNPWDRIIKECVPGVNNTLMDGRPPGEFFAHQRWEEFFPKVFFQSAQAGARVNLGMRDRFQRHHYRYGEFAPGGLYHGQGTTRGTEARIHPSMPVQNPTTVWTFDGTFPPKLLMSRYGVPVLFRHHNALPVDPSANSGFGIHYVTTHEHNGHNPAESDGYTHAYSYPGQFFDYHWPMILAGRDSINKSALDYRAGSPDGQGGVRRIRGDYRETMSTHWFHDHTLDFTAQNVYKGNVAMMNYYSAMDRGHEPRSINQAKWGSRGYGCHYANEKYPNLCLPSGTARDWGNRDYDVNLLLADKAWDQQGQLWFNIFNTDGFLGDRMTVNWQYKPFLDVRARRYRFRILNGSVSRYFKLALVDQNGNRVPFHMIANDGNIMEHAISFPNSQSADLPTQATAERYDIVVDFSRFREGDRLYFVNIMEHTDGKGPKRDVDLQQVLSGQYNGDPAVGKFMEFRVKAMRPGAQDLSMNPVDYEPGKKKMLVQPTFTEAELKNARHRTFEFGRSNGSDQKPWTIKTDGGEGLGMDPRRLSAAPRKESVEIWHIENGGSGWSHPVHIHFEEGKILSRGGNPPPIWEQGARKDMYRIGDMSDSTQSVVVALRFREFAGSYVEHCHNTQHEDTAMLLRWDVLNPGQTVAIPAPMPDWEGVKYEETIPLSTAFP